MVVQRSCKAKGEGSNPFFGTIHMESNAAGLVLRLALKTRFSVMGLGFDSSATRHNFNSVLIFMVSMLGC